MFLQIHADNCSDELNRQRWSYGDGEEIQTQLEVPGHVYIKVAKWSVQFELNLFQFVMRNLCILYKRPCAAYQWNYLPGLTLRAYSA